MRTRTLVEQSETVYYLAYMWECSVCGKSWIDDGLEHLNARAEDEARTTAREGRTMSRKAS